MLFNIFFSELLLVLEGVVITSCADDDFIYSVGENFDDLITFIQESSMELSNIF